MESWKLSLAFLVVAANIWVMVQIVAVREHDVSPQNCTRWIIGAEVVADRIASVRSQNGLHAIKNAYYWNELPVGCGDDDLMHNIDLTIQGLVGYYDWVLTRNNADASNILFDADAEIHRLQSMVHEFAQTRK